MSRRLALVAVVALAGALAACGSGGDSAGGAGTGPDGATVAVGGPPTPAATAPMADDAEVVGGIAGAVEVAAGAVGESETAACDLSRDNLEQASEMFLALNGALPTAQVDLVDAKLVQEASPWFEITGDGTIVPLAGGPCA